MRENIPLPCIAVQTSEDVITSEVCHQHTQEGEVKICLHVSGIGKPWQAGWMEREHIYQESYQCPCLLWVPLPVGSPSRFCPDSSKDDASGKEQFGGEEHAAGGTEEEEGEEAVGEHDCSDVGGEPRTVEGWSDGCYLRIERAEVGHKQR